MAGRIVSLVGLLVLCFPLAACRSVAVEVVPVDQDPTVVVAAYCTGPDGAQHLVAGLSCELLREGARSAWGISGATPLVFRDLAPGRYELLVRGTSRHVAHTLDVPERGRVSVSLDLTQAEEVEPPLLARAR